MRRMFRTFDEASEVYRSADECAQPINDVATGILGAPARSRPIAAATRLRPLRPRLTIRWEVDPASNRPVARWVVEHALVQPLGRLYGDEPDSKTQSRSASQAALSYAACSRHSPIETRDGAFRFG